MLGICPHVVAWRETGSVRFGADYDDLLYRVWARAVERDGSLRLIDGVHARPGPPMHPWLLFVPPGLIARALGMDLGLTWRILAGIGLGFGLFAAARPWVKTGRGAALLASFLLCEAGFLFGQPLQREAEVVWSLWSGGADVLDGVPRLLPHFRVPTPSLPLAVLLVHLGALQAARRFGSRRGEIAATLSFGLLFHVYFYFWTAAGGALALAWLLDREGRKTYFRVALVGGLIGLAALIQGARIKATTPPDWLPRTDKFIPIGRFEELLLPKLLLGEFAVLTPIVFLKRKDLIHLWCLTLAGLLCANHQIVTRLQIENFHWIYAYGVGFSLLCACLVAPWLDKRKGIVMGLAVLIWGLAAFGLRVAETRSAETLELAGIASGWKASGIELPRGSVPAGDVYLLFHAAAVGEGLPLAGRLVEYSTAATDEELDERMILDLYLQNRDRDRIREAASPALIVFGQDPQSKRDPEVARLKEERRHLLIDKILADPIPYLNRYGVTHLILPVGETPPAAMKDLFRKATENGAGPWSLWERSKIKQP